jgi:hypothetical protein
MNKIMKVKSGAAGFPVHRAELNGQQMPARNTNTRRDFVAEVESK